VELGKAQVYGKESFEMFPAGTKADVLAERLAPIVVIIVVASICTHSLLPISSTHEEDGRQVKRCQEKKRNFSRRKQNASCRLQLRVREAMQI
jgi:hypothetical protein